MDQKPSVVSRPLSFAVTNPSNCLRGRCGASLLAMSNGPRTTDKGLNCQLTKRLSLALHLDAQNLRHRGRDVDVPDGTLGPCASGHARPQSQQPDAAAGLVT